MVEKHQGEEVTIWSLSKGHQGLAALQSQQQVNNIILGVRRQTEPKADQWQTWDGASVFWV